jgi:hypothetical protein
MTMNHRTGHVLVRASDFRPGDITRLNQILDVAGLGQPLRDPAEGQAAGGTAALINVPLHPDADPLAIEAAVQDAQGVPAVFADHPFSAGTTVGGKFFFKGAGKKSGHGLGWVPAPDEEMPQAPARNENGPHPVIALLDSGVQRHEWFGADHGASFVQDADGLDCWSSPVLADDPPGPSRPIGTHWGHGTFIAGLLRQAAPQAQVLSMRLMDSAGSVDSGAVVNALKWLARPHAALPRIVLMAFGRQASPHDPALDDLRCAVRTLTDRGVTVVASAGNDSSSDPVYPAAFAAEAGIPVISVGAIVGRHKMAPYSNFGPWVKAGWLGTDIVSIHPQTYRNAGGNQIQPNAIDTPTEPRKADSFAWWSGTSFAAAIVAGGLAAGHNPALTLPLPPDPDQP